MDSTQRKLTVITSLGKRYSGLVDIPNLKYRTTDLFNSAYTFWKNPEEKCLEDSIMMHDAKLLLDDTSVYRQFDKIQIRTSEIFIFFDDAPTVGDEMEKKRASTAVKQQAREEFQEINIITRQVACSFYDITGTFFGIFRQKAKDRFVPLTQADIVEIYKKPDNWIKKTIPLPHHFICISTDHIESVTIR